MFVGGRDRGDGQAVGDVTERRAARLGGDVRGHVRRRPAAARQRRRRLRRRTRRHQHDQRARQAHAHQVTHTHVCFQSSLAHQ
jgi:hypothetical protein